MQKWAVIVSVVLVILVGTNVFATVLMNGKGFGVSFSPPTPCGDTTYPWDPLVWFLIQPYVQRESRGWAQDQAVIPSTGKLEQCQELVNQIISGPVSNLQEVCCQAMNAGCFNPNYNYEYSQGYTYSTLINKCNGENTPWGFGLPDGTDPSEWQEHGFCISALNP